MKPTPPDLIHVAMPDQSKSVNLRPLWIDDQIALNIGDKCTKSQYLIKLEHIMDEMNDRVEALFLNSEKYNSASSEFKRNIKKALQYTRRDFMANLVSS